MRFFAEQGAGVVPRQRAEERTERPGDHHAKDVQLATCGEKPGQRHDHFRGNRREQVFQQHQRENAEVAALADQPGNRIEHVKILVTERGNTTAQPVAGLWFAVGTCRAWPVPAAASLNRYTA